MTHKHIELNCSLPTSALAYICIGLHLHLPTSSFAKVHRFEIFVVFLPSRLAFLLYGNNGPFPPDIAALAAPLESGAALVQVLALRLAASAVALALRLLLLGLLLGSKVPLDKKTIIVHNEGTNKSIPGAT